MPESDGEELVRKKLMEDAEEKFGPGCGKPEFKIRWLGFALSPIVIFGVSPMRPFGLTFWFYAWGVCIGPHWIVRIRKPRR